MTANKRLLKALVIVLVMCGVLFQLTTLRQSTLTTNKQPHYTERAVLPMYDLLAADFLSNISKPYYGIVEKDDFSDNESFFSLYDSQVSHIPETFLIQAVGTCRGKGGVKVVFVVPSVATAEDSQRRLIIRKTWASHIYDDNWRQASSPTRLVFFLGGSDLDDVQLSSLQTESAIFKDVVIVDFHDSYHNLSLKMTSAITWVARNCPSVEAMVKVDMDTYLNVGALLSLVDQLPVESHPYFMFGHQHVYDRPPVTRVGQWKVKSEYPFPYFPRYLYGHSYVISGPALKQLTDSFPYFPIIPNEDAFITGIMAVTLNITRFHHQSFANLLFSTEPCEMVFNSRVSTIFEPSEFIRTWKAIENRECIDTANSNRSNIN